MRRWSLSVAVIAFVAGAAAQSAPASHWWLIDMPRGRDAALLVDENSITTTGAMKGARLAVVTRIDDVDHVAKLEASVEVDCPGSRFRFVSRAVLDAAGGRLAVPLFDPENVAVASPERMPLVRYVCARRPRDLAWADFGSNPTVARVREFLNDTGVHPAAQKPGTQQ